MSNYRLLIVAMATVLLGACGDAGKATVLHYAEQEPGGEAYRTRIIVTSRWLRIDEGHESRDFLLFDRHDKMLYSVNAVDTRILAMSAKPVDMVSPTKLEHRVERDKEVFPAVGGKKVTRYTLLTNRKPCYDLFAAEGMLPEAVQALREYREILAGQQVAALSAMPKELQTPCDLANNIFAPTRYLDYGLPVRLSETGVRTSELVDFQTDFNAVPGLFELPASFRRLTLEDMRGR